jgi:ankyrin repeat protein
MLYINDTRQSSTYTALYPNVLDQTGWTPLMKACLFSNLEQVRNLISDESVSVNSQSKNGWTALTIAILTNSRKIIRLLITVGANDRIRDKADNLPTYYATSTNESAITSLIHTAKRKRNETLQKYLLPELVGIILDFL